MRPATKLAVAGLVLGAVGSAVLGASRLATAQSQGGSQAPLPSVDVSISESVRFDTNVTNVVAVSGPEGARLMAEVTGLSGGSVLISGPVTATISGTPTFALPSSTLSLLAGQRNCAYTSILNPLVDGGTILELQSAPGQTGITVTAHDFGAQVDHVTCWPSETPDGGPLPDCSVGGVGYPIHENASWSLDITSANRIRCVACAHGANPAQSTAMLGGGVSVCAP